MKVDFKFLVKAGVCVNEMGHLKNPVDYFANLAFDYTEELAEPIVKHGNTNNLNSLLEQIPDKDLKVFSDYLSLILPIKFYTPTRSVKPKWLVHDWVGVRISGGPLGDKLGRKRVILGSILGAAPFSLALPFVSLPVTLVLVFVVGFIIASAFPAIVVYGQELMPGKTGTISGLFFGLSFGIAGIGAAAVGALADIYSIQTVYRICALLPLLGLLAFMLPEMRARQTL